MSGRVALMITALCVMAWVASAAAEPAATGQVAVLDRSLPPVSALPEASGHLDALLHPPFSERWRESIYRERARDYESAATLRKALVAELPGEVHLHWRIARDLVHAAEVLHLDETSRRTALYEEALEWALRGRSLAPTCGECCLYEFAARARLLSPDGGLPSPASIRRVGNTLEACLAQPPSWRDGPRESELGNLYYGAATFYRRLPASRWFQWIAGVRGDRERAVSLGRQALSLAPGRVDYHVELGAALLCLASERDDVRARAEGIAWLERSFELNEWQPSDATDRERARAMIGDPGRACGDSRVGFLRGS
jgi:hypothetical protein